MTVHIKTKGTYLDDRGKKHRNTKTSTGTLYIHLYAGGLSPQVTMYADDGKVFPVPLENIARFDLEDRL